MVVATFRNRGEGSSGGGVAAPDPLDLSHPSRTKINERAMRPNAVLVLDTLEIGHHDAGWRADEAKSIGARALQTGFGHELYHRVAAACDPVV